jgi:hypothetical protein
MDSWWWKSACRANNLQPNAVKDWAMNNKHPLSIFEQFFEVEDAEAVEDRSGRGGIHKRACSLDIGNFNGYIA